METTAGPVVDLLESLHKMGFWGGAVAAVVGSIFLIDKILKWRAMLAGRNGSSGTVVSGRRLTGPVDDQDLPASCSRAHNQMADSMQSLAETIRDLVREVAALRETTRDNRDEVRSDLRDLAREIRSGQ